MEEFDDFYIDDEDNAWGIKFTPTGLAIYTKAANWVMVTEIPNEVLGEAVQKWISSYK